MWLTIAGEKELVGEDLPTFRLTLFRQFCAIAMAAESKRRFHS